MVISAGECARGITAVPGWIRGHAIGLRTRIGEQREAVVTHIASPERKTGTLVVEGIGAGIGEIRERSALVAVVAAVGLVFDRDEICNLRFEADDAKEVGVEIVGTVKIARPLKI